MLKGKYRDKEEELASVKELNLTICNISSNSHSNDICLDRTIPFAITLGCRNISLNFMVLMTRDRLEVTIPDDFFEKINDKDIAEDLYIILHNEPFVFFCYEFEF